MQSARRPRHLFIGSEVEPDGWRREPPCSPSENRTKAGRFKVGGEKQIKQGFDHPSVTIKKTGRCPVFLMAETEGL